MTDLSAVQRRQDDMENNVILTPAWDSWTEILGEKNSESEIKHTVYLANIESLGMTETSLWVKLLWDIF